MSIFKNKVSAISSTKKKYNILIVDDEEANVRSLIRLFEKEYNVYSAFNGKEALKLVERKELHFHLIISDQKMPLMNGIDFLKETLKSSPGTIRIILSAFTDLDVIISSINDAQIYKFIVKPIDIREMLLTVKRALQAYELNDKNLYLLEEIKKKNNDLQSLAEDCSDEKNKTQGSSLSKKEIQHIFDHNITMNLESLENYLNSYQDDHEFMRFRNQLLRLTKSNIELIAIVKKISNHQDVEKSFWNLASLIKQLTVSLEHKLKEKQIELDIKINPDIEINVERLSFVNIALLNILSNAIKFSFNKSTIKIICNSIEDKYAVIAIVDKGSGIEKNIQDSIFDGKIENIRPGTIEESGDGLGLKITKKILENFNAGIKIHSKQDETRQYETEVQLIIQGRINKFANS